MGGHGGVAAETTHLQRQPIRRRAAGGKPRLARQALRACRLRGGAAGEQAAHHQAVHEPAEAGIVS